MEFVSLKIWAGTLESSDKSAGGRRKRGRAVALLAVETSSGS